MLRRKDSKDMGRAEGYVRFNNVSFSYDERIPALKHVDIDAPPGQVTAILGAPGSGKSTIVNLPPRFYEVTEGEVTIDGSGKAQELREEYFKSERLQGTNSAWMTLYFTFALGLIVWYGGWEVIRGDLTAGELTQFVLYLNQLTFPIRAAAQIVNSFSRAISSGRRIFDVLDARSPVEEKSDAKDMGRAEGYVRFNNVSFSYDERIPALKHVDIDAHRKRRIRC